MMIFTIVGNICVCPFVPDRLGIRFNQLPCNQETGLEQTSKSPPAEIAVNVQGLLLITSTCKQPSGDCLGRGQRPGAGRALSGFLECLDMNA